MGAAVAFTNVISGSQVGPNKELTFKFAITKADSASVGGSICSSTLTLERRRRRSREDPEFIERDRGE